MDSISHLAMGTGIAILATNTGVIDNEYKMITFGAVIAASVLPDIDVVTKIKGNKTYINQHRGFTHSIIFLVLLTLLSNFIVNMFLPKNEQHLLAGWLFFSIFMHILTDVFNNYGVKLFWPFQDRWVSLSATYTIDFFILAIHGVGFALYYLLGFNGSYVFASILTIVIMYLIITFIRKEFRVMYIKTKLDNVRKVTLIAKPLAHQWKFVAATHDDYYIIGDLRGNKFTELFREKKQPLIDDKLYQIIKHDLNLRIFMKFTKVYNWDIISNGNITEIRVRDLTYYAKIGKDYTFLFNCVIYVDTDKNEIVNTYLGFNSSEDNLYKMVGHKNIIQKIKEAKKHE